ncbi:MAG: isochorismatase family protein [Pyrinomonadaceae bacterium]
MTHPAILNSRQTALIVVDFQEAFRSVIPEFPQIATHIWMAARGFQILNLPIFVTEQYPKGLGRTAEEVLLALPDDFEFIEKSAFSSCGANGFTDKLKSANVSQVVLCGLETHICVNQTAHDLQGENFQVHLLTDCTGARDERDKQTAIAKMQMNGVIPACVEMSLFELLRDSKHEHFKEIQNLIK